MRLDFLTSALVLVLVTLSQSCGSTSFIEPIEMDQLSSREKLFLIDLVPLGTRKDHLVGKFPQLTYRDEETLAMSLDVNQVTVGVDFSFDDSRLVSISYSGGQGNVHNLYRKMKLYCSQLYTPGETTGNQDLGLAHHYHGNGVEVLLNWNSGGSVGWSFEGSLTPKD